MADETVLVIKVDSSDLPRAKRELEAFGFAAQEAEKKGSGLTKSFGGIKAALASLGVLAAAGALLKLGQAAVETGSKFENLGLQMKAVMGSESGAAQATAWIKKFAVDTPYQLEQVSAAFVKLKAMGIDPMNGAMQAIADQTSFLGGDIQVLESITLALGKAWTKGKLQGEELMMMMERGVPVARYLSQSMGVAEESIAELAEKGKITRKEIQGLIETMGKATSGASLNLMNSFTGAWSNLQDTIATALNEIAEGGLLDSVKTAVLDLKNVIEQLSNSGELRRWGETAASSVQAVEVAFKALFMGIPLGIKLVTSILMSFSMKIVTTFNEISLKVMGTIQRIFSPIAEAVRKHSDLFGSAGEALVGFYDTFAEHNKDVARGIDITTEATGQLEMQAADALNGIKDLFAPKENPVADEVKKIGTEADTARGKIDLLAQAWGNVGNRDKGGGVKDFTSGKAPKTVYDQISNEEKARAAARKKEAEARIEDFNSWLAWQEEALYKWRKDDAEQEEKQRIERVEKEREAAWKAAQAWEDAYGGAFRILTNSISGVIQEAFMDGFSRDDLMNNLNSTLADAANLFGQQLQESLAAAVRSGDWKDFATLDNPSQSGFQLNKGWSQAGMAFGLGLMQSGIQNQSSRDAAIGGAITGASAGAQAGGWIGALIGGVVGGGMGWSSVDPEGAGRWFGGRGVGLWPHSYVTDSLDRFTDPLGFFESPDPQTTTLETTLTGGSVSTAHQGSTEDQREIFLQEVLALQRRLAAGFRETLMSFGDATLFDLTSAFEGISSTEFEGSMQEVLTQLSQVTLPEAFQDNFAAAFQQGLTNLGLTAYAIDELGNEIANLPLDDRLTALQTVILALRQVQDLGALDPLEVINRSSADQFSVFIGEANDEVALLTAGWESMSMIDRAAELQRIGDVWASVLDQTMQYLARIQDAQDAINRSAGEYIQSLRVGLMSDEERVSYYAGEVATGMGSLSSATSVEGIQEAYSETMGSIQSYEQSLREVQAATIAANEANAAARESIEAIGQSFDEMASRDLLAEMARSSMDAWDVALADATGSIADLSAGFEDLSLPEIAANLSDIGAVWEGVLQNAAQILSQIDATRNEVQSTYEGARESLLVGRMSPSEREGYFSGQVATGMSAIRNAQSPEAAARAAADTFAAIQNLRDILEAAAADFSSAAETVQDLASFSFEDLGMTAAEAFDRSMSEGTDRLSEMNSDLVSGMDELGLPERAEQLREIADIWSGALQNTIQMLQEIDRVQQGINESFNRALEDLAVGGMSDAEKESYYRSQIDTTLTAIETATSAEDVGALSSQLMEYIQQLQGLYSSSPQGLYGEDASGQSFADIIQSMLEHGQESANERLDAIRATTETEYATLAEQATAAAEALGAFGENVGAAVFDEIDTLLGAANDAAMAVLDGMESTVLAALESFETQVEAAELALTGFAGTIEDVAAQTDDEIAAAIIAMIEAAQETANAGLDVLREDALETLENFEAAVNAAADALWTFVSHADQDDQVTRGRAIDDTPTSYGGQDGDRGGPGNHDPIDYDDQGYVDDWDPNSWGGQGKSGGKDDVSSIVAGMEAAIFAFSSASGSGVGGILEAQLDAGIQSAEILAQIAANSSRTPVVNVEISGSIAALEPMVRTIVAEMTRPPSPAVPQSGGIY